MSIFATITAHAAPVLAFAPPTEGGESNPFMGLMPLILIMVIFYFLIIRPQQKRQKEHQNMVSALSRGDRVLTNGGIYATVQDVHDDKLVVVIGDGVKVEIAKNAVANKVTPPSKDAGKSKSKDDDKKSKK